MAQQGQPCEYKRMVDTEKNPGARAQIEEIERACGFRKRSDLSRLIGVSPQRVDNWRKRGWTKDALILLPDKTGVDPRWMNGQSKVAFPDGVKVKPLMTVEQRIGRVETDIDQARNVMAALFVALESKLQGIGEVFESALHDVAPSKDYSQKGFHGLLLAWLAHRKEIAEAAQASSQADAILKSVGRTHAKKDRT